MVPGIRSMERPSVVLPDPPLIVLHRAIQESKAVWICANPECILQAVQRGV